VDCIIYETKPEDFNPKFETAVCFLDYKNTFLMLLRQDYKPFGNTWCLPGGKKDDNETLEECAARETYEETGFELDKKLLKYSKTVYVNNKGLEYVYHMFKYHIQTRIKPILRETEHKKYMWVKPDRALKMNLIPGQDKCILQVYPAAQS
jgi:8-oxo-dGTP pyrophosphatase MutT (NUDIX family)